jgi:hypothetical protein
MLGVIELERDERRRRRAAIRDGTNSYEPAARAVEPRIAAALVAAALPPALAALEVRSTAGSARAAASVQGAIPMKEMKRCSS